MRSDEAVPLRALEAFPGRHLQGPEDCDTEMAMTSSQLILVSVTSALIAVFAMLLVATVSRARRKDTEDRKD